MMQTCSSGIEEDVLSKRIYEKNCVFNDDYPIYIYIYGQINKTQKHAGELNIAVKVFVI